MPNKKFKTTDSVENGIGTTPGRNSYEAVTLEQGVATTPGTEGGIGTTPSRRKRPNGRGQAMAEARRQLRAAKGFRCEINGQFVPIISYSGGDLTGEKAEASSGSSQHNESTLGHNYITELTLVTFVTPDDNTLSDAADLVANQGKDMRYTIVITELAKDKSVVKTLVFDNCLLTSMHFPAADSEGGEMLKRTSTWKPEILTVS